MFASSTGIDLKLTLATDQVYEITFNGEFLRFAKEAEVREIFQEINTNILPDGNNQITLPTLKIKDECLFKIKHDNQQDLKNILQYGVNKKKVELPAPLNMTYSNQTDGKHPQVPTVYSYHDLSAYHGYWKSGEAGIQKELFALLSADLIEIPYADDATDYTFHANKIAYHTNHGTTHALRQIEHAKSYIALLQFQGKEPWKEIAAHLSPEERACIQLALMLFRTGRTNEASWDLDTSFGVRSAKIFHQVAMDLGFNENLVSRIADCFNYHANPANEDNKNKNIINKDFVRLIFQLSHETDLVRCNATFLENKKSIATVLGNVLKDNVDTEKVADSFTKYAVQLCQSTGAPISVINIPWIKYISEKKDVSVRCAINPAATMHDLNGIKPSILPIQTKLSVDEFCELTSAQLNVWSAEDVVDRANIKHRDDIEKIINKLHREHRSWNIEEEQVLRNKFAIDEFGHAKIIKPQVSSLSSMTQAALLNTMKEQQIQHRVTEHQPKLSVDAIEQTRKLPVDDSQLNVDQHQITELAHSLKDRKPPTLAWLKGRDRPENWNQEDADKIPVNQCILTENEHLDTHISVYHATTRQSYALDMFCTALSSYGLLGSNSAVGTIAWIRHLHDTPPKKAPMMTNMNEFRKSMQTTIDNSDIQKWQILSCNPSVWQNTDRASEEATADYYFTNGSASVIPFEYIFNNILDTCELLLVSDKDLKNKNLEIRKSIFKKLMSAADNESYGNQGIMYQYLIPWNKVNSVAAISGDNGILDTDNPDTLKTLLQLQTDSNRPPNADKLQVRLLIPKLLDPAFSADIKIKNYSSMPAEKWRDFHKIIRHCAFHAIQKKHVTQDKNEIHLTDESKLSQTNKAVLDKRVEIPPAKKSPIEENAEKIMILFDAIRYNRSYWKDKPDQTELNKILRELGAIHADTKVGTLMKVKEYFNRQQEQNFPKAFKELWMALKEADPQTGKSERLATLSSEIQNITKVASTPTAINTPGKHL